MLVNVSYRSSIHRATKDRFVGRRAFTLLELLAVMAIITVLISMLLPAIQQSRETARRLQCKNNLMQIGLALCNYDSAHGCLPSGSVDPNRPIQNTPSGYHFGWIAQILPQLEQPALYTALDFSVGVHDKKNAATVARKVNVLICPSGMQLQTGSHCSYPACHHDLEAPIDIDNAGVMFLNSSFRRDDLFDGASNTIFVGETSEWGMNWAVGTRDTLRNTGSPINGVVIPTVNAQSAYITKLKPTEVGGFSSPHSAGANFLLGDGSVRFISENLTMRVFRQLGNRADGALPPADY